MTALRLSMALANDLILVTGSYATTNYKMAAITRLSSDDHNQVDSCSRVDTSHLRVKGSKGYQSANVFSRLFWL